MKNQRIRWLLALLVAPLVCHAQTALPLTPNGDGTWSLEHMPTYNMKMEVDYDDGTGIDEITATPTDQGDGYWYSLDGRRLMHQPTTKGVYIHNGRKIVR